ncbi:MAG: type II toxin-antitoxin system VapC family toxin [Acidobacteriota bacterium]|nr:type II toxin-antitoxin system VapC family toxin [Acidobacteriota bacterium]
MITLDASAVVEMLRGGSLADLLWRELLQSGEPIIVPHLLDIEAVSALRRLASEERIDSYRAEQFIEALELLPAKRYEHTPLLDRIWELRHNFTSYDATYISLAEATGAVLCTCDRKLAKGHRAQVRVFANS